MTSLPLVAQSSDIRPNLNHTFSIAGLLQSRLTRKEKASNSEVS